MITPAALGATLRQILTTTADQIGRETGFVQRRSKLSGSRFVATLVCGWLTKPTATLGELAQTAAALQVPVSPQALDQRFGPAAAACLEEVLATAVRALVVAEPVTIPVLERFTGVYVQDSSSIPLPAALADNWPGCGGRTPGAGQASLKIQVRLELRRGQLSGPELEAGRAQDRASALQHTLLPAGSLRLNDLGYFSLAVLRACDQAGVYWFSRYQVQTVVSDRQGRRREDLARWLTQQGAVVDHPILLGAQERLACRLVAARLPAALVNRRRRRLRAEAKREGQTPSQVKLALAGWNLFVTNVPVELLSPEEALVLARVRWQIELLFKLWKSHGQIDQSRSTKPWRILCEVYAKLLAMVVQHWLLLLSCWHAPDRSLFRAAQTVQKLGLALAGTLHDPAGLTATIAIIQRCLASGCRLDKRRGRPSTYQRLLATAATVTRPDPAHLASSAQEQAA